MKIDPKLIVAAARRLDNARHFSSEGREELVRIDLESVVSDLVEALGVDQRGQEVIRLLVSAASKNDFESASRDGRVALAKCRPPEARSDRP